MDDVDEEVSFRRATSRDVDAVVSLLADDELGRGREQPGDPAYRAAFAEIDADPNQLLIVAERAGEIVGTLQLSLLAGLSHLGTKRAQLEAVRVRSDLRGLGVGKRMCEWAISAARQRGAGQLQLTSDSGREDAHRFYERLGFSATHVGMKMHLD
ncbi:MULTISPECIES: GNAT family N-acetyltransferase [Actinopolyspora]|uniref:Ribosomal protein S18 acetylase RimI n=1 Tax=Actinopolyspora saharensis TaxID=995062 RepID=A0A1H1D5N0_9ACTN|nr:MULTISPECIES: GNAT family N-acetyltransferase [Actinopolyspora]NHD17275.1 GNAT family N-acetyltransferase [Actinopolyspora sp. BKK2]NHE76427.1 GNAT family N-acetyltransferase [Actinopolyspora sp. BKK1]SDQ71136.1 Ribosomal protein S18 acetylase RimI [Actinopolyspora saharensis]